MHTCLNLQTQEHTSAVCFFSFLFPRWRYCIMKLLTQVGTPAVTWLQVCAHSKPRLTSGIKLWIIHTSVRNWPVACADDFTYGSNKAVQNIHISRLGWHAVVSVYPVLWESRLFSDMVPFYQTRRHHIWDDCRLDLRNGIFHSRRQ
jgi:hypothetical protein